MLSLPSLYRAFRAGRVFTGLSGVSVDIKGHGYVPAPTTPQREAAQGSKNSRAVGYLSAFRSVLLWSPLGFGLNIGQSMSMEFQLLFRLSNN